MPNVIKCSAGEAPLRYPIFSELLPALREEKTGEETPDALHLRLREEAVAITARARQEAQELVERAREQANSIRATAFETGHAAGEETGFQNGYDRGCAEGVRRGREQGQQMGMEQVSQQFAQLLGKLNETLATLEQEKEQFLRQYRRDLTLLTVHIAEQVIGLNLSASARAIEKMIENAVDGMKPQEWIKISVSDEDLALLTREHADVARLLEHVSAHVRLEAIEGARQGTLIVETPDRIVDACSSVQIEQIKACLEELDDEFFGAE